VERDRPVCEEEDRTVVIKIAGKRAWWVEFGEEAEGTAAVVLLSIAYKFVVFGEALSSLHRLILGDCCRHSLHTPPRSITSPSLTVILNRHLHHFQPF
jgi:hypothetical protein